MPTNDFEKRILNDLRVELLDEFDRNFERKAFFDQKWQEARSRNSRGSLLLRSGRLRKSIRGRVVGHGISFSSSMPYASIHNNGGTISITPKMRRFFWAMHYKNLNGVSFSIKTRAPSTKHAAAQNDKANHWRNMAMLRGESVKMPQRQFIGQHTKVDQIVREVIDQNFKQLTDELSSRFKQRLNNR